MSNAYVEQWQDNAKHLAETGLYRPEDERDGDHRAYQCRDLRAVDSEGAPADHRERYAGLLPHVPGEVHEEVHQRRTNGQR